MRHVLVSYRFELEEGTDAELAASRFTAEASTGHGLIEGNRRSWHEFTESSNAHCYKLDVENGDMRIAFFLGLFDRSLLDGRIIMSSVLAAIRSTPVGMKGFKYCEVQDIFFPIGINRLFDGPSVTIASLWRTLGRPHIEGGMIVGAVLRPKMAHTPQRATRSMHYFWQEGDLVRCDTNHRNQPYCSMAVFIPQVAECMRAAIEKTGKQKLFAANITADDPFDMIQRGKFVLEKFGPLAPNCAFFVDGHCLSAMALTTVRRSFPDQFIFFHDASRGASTSSGSVCGYSDVVRAKISRLMGASGLCMDEDPDSLDNVVLSQLETDIVKSDSWFQEMEGMNPTAPVYSGEINALRLPFLLERVGHSHILVTAGEGALSHRGGPNRGALSLREAEAAWRRWKEGDSEAESLQACVIEHAQTNDALMGAFMTFESDADSLYPGWREALAERSEELKDQAVGRGSDGRRH